MPVASAATIVNATTGRSSVTCSSRGTGMRSPTSASRPRWQQRRHASPAMPPAAASTRLSVSIWRTSRPRPAPSAVRTPTSRSRAALRASSRFATLTQATSSTSTTAPDQREQRGPELPDHLFLQRKSITVRPALRCGSSFSSSA